MSAEKPGGRLNGLARVASTYFFMFFFGPVAWQLWMSLRLGFLSLDESRRCLQSPSTICIAVLLFALNVANMARGTERIGPGKGGTVPHRMFLHYASLLAFATIGTAVSMSALTGAGGGGVSARFRTVVGSLLGGSMCFVFYAASTASVIARLAPPERRPGGILARTRAVNAGLFSIGLPLFVGTSLVAASLGDGDPGAGRTARLLASMAVPVTMGSVLFVRADKRIARLRGAAGEEFPR